MKIIVSVIALILIGLIVYFSSSLTNTSTENMDEMPPPPDQIIDKNKPAIFNKNNVLVKDPVCGKLVEKDSNYSVKFLDKVFFFCSEEHMNIFKKDHEKYVKVKINVKVKDQPQITPENTENQPLKIENLDNSENSEKKDKINNSDGSYPDDTVEKIDETNSGEKPVPEKTVEDNY